MIKKIALIILILIIGYLFYCPIIVQLANMESPKTINFQPSQTFMLKDILKLKNTQNVTIYVVLNNEERKHFSSQVPKWNVLKSNDSALIKDLLNCKFKYTGSDVSTLQSSIYIYSENNLVFESEISLETNNPGLQNSYTGWVSPIDNNRFLNIISKCNRYNLPLLILK